MTTAMPAPNMAASESAAACLEMRGIAKAFHGVPALSDVSFDCYAGEVHAICGENGAGKSTLMKVLGGIYRPDSGSIWSINSQSQQDDQLEQITNWLHATCGEAALSSTVQSRQLGVFLTRVFPSADTSRTKERWAHLPGKYAAGGSRGSPYTAAVLRSGCCAFEAAPD